MAKSGGGHAEHGGGGGDASAFRQAVGRFIEQYRQPDGSVQVEGPSPGDMPGTTMGGMAHAHSHAISAKQETAAAMPTEVYMLAQQWSFEPSWLRLRAGAPYRLKLMAADVAHGASLQLGLGGHIIRLPKGVLVERDMTFTRPGSYLVYCTVYCGEGHQFMSGKLEVM
jgi:heme/copper-type cytochrome/quinol oxidase subunit 2